MMTIISDDDNHHTCNEKERSNTVSINPDCPRIMPFDLSVRLEAYFNIKQLVTHTT